MQVYHAGYDDGVADSDIPNAEGGLRTDGEIIAFVAEQIDDIWTADAGQSDAPMAYLVAGMLEGNPNGGTDGEE